jgi:hypothetical protein
VPSNPDNKFSFRSTSLNKEYSGCVNPSLEAKRELEFFLSLNQELKPDIEPELIELIFSRLDGSKLFPDTVKTLQSAIASELTEDGYQKESRTVAALNTFEFVALIYEYFRN